MLEKPQPRPNYGFETMKVNDVKKVLCPDHDAFAGERVRAAAYAYGRRNGWKFCGANDVICGKSYMLIRRIA